MRQTLSLICILCAIWMASCSHKGKNPTPEAAPSEANSQQEAAPTTAAPEQEMKFAKHTDKLTEKHSAARGPVPADKALGWLRNGNIRFTKARLRNDGQSSLDRVKLSTGQKPHSIVLSCSDSRVPPELVFDQKLGEIFVVRSAGQNPDNSAIASIEYALEHLGSNLIVVMGHQSCGAVKAAVTTKEGQDVGSPFLNRLVTQIKARIPASEKRQAASQDFVQEGWDNVYGIAEELKKKSTIIREAVESGEVRIQPALYQMSSGQVSWDRQ